jgi:hypothetical protein
LQKIFFNSTNKNYNPDKSFLMNICFNKWKKAVIDNIKRPLLNELKLQNFTNFFMKKYYSNFQIFLNRLKILKSKEIEKINLFNKKTTILFSRVNRIINQQIKTYFENLKENAYEKLITRKKLLKLIIWYKKFNQKNLNKLTLHNKFFKWKSLNSKLKSETHLKNLKIYTKLTTILSHKSLKHLKLYFKKFRISTSKRKIFSRSEQIHTIDHLIIKNQNIILTQLELEEQKVDQEISQQKQLIKEKSKLYILTKHIYKKHSFNLFQYFSLWKRITRTSKFDVEILESYDNIINEGENIRIFHDKLVTMYEEKKTNYQKVLEDYEVFKKNFCSKCVLDEQFNISYKSLTHLNLNTLCDGEQMMTNQDVSHDSSADSEESKKFFIVRYWN